MQVKQLLWIENKGWKGQDTEDLSDAHLVIYFGGQGTLDTGARYAELKALYPAAHLLGCSTGGEIYNGDVLDKSVVAAVVKFDKTKLRATAHKISDPQHSYECGRKIGEALSGDSLKNIFLLSDGTQVNGSDLVRGIYSVLDKKIIVTGGLAGDAADFKKTLVGLNASPDSGSVAAVGFYGDGLRVGYGSIGGWDVFGPERIITRSKGNTLYELDGRPALDLYKEYLGPDDAKKLPGSALLFPLNIRPEKGSENEMVRTVVGVNESEKSMTFAGDVPEGYIAQLMHGDFGNLIKGAAHAAELAGGAQNNPGSLAILVSCIGRKLLLGQNISDETEAIAEQFKQKIPMVGFYSYGEICHQQFTGDCALHNQTMTVTVLHEI
jgi:hypothetical protein